MTGEPLNDAELQELAGITRELLDLIRHEIEDVDFWRYPEEQTRLRKQIGIRIDELGLVPYQRRGAAAARLISLARALHARLLNQDTSPTCTNRATTAPSGNVSSKLCPISPHANNGPPKMAADTESEHPKSTTLFQIVSLHKKPHTILTP